MIQDLLQDPQLKKLVRMISPHEMIFRQGERISTMFLILEGEVQLTQKTLNNTRIVEVLTAGDILGEKVLVTDDTTRKRTMNAVALTEVAVLEFDYHQLQLVQTKLPNFTASVLRVVSQRLDKANDLIGVLQLKDDCEKFIHFLLFFAKYHGKKNVRGVQVLLPLELIVSNLNCEESFAKSILEQLLKQKLIFGENEVYTIPDENALVVFVPSLKERLAA